MPFNNKRCIHNSEKGNPAAILPLTDRFVNQLISNCGSPVSMRIVIIQHLLEDTEAFIHILKRTGFLIEQVIGIEYSSKRHVVERLVDQGIDAIVPEFAKLKRTIKSCLRAIKKEQRCSSITNFLVHEVGGYCADLLNEDMSLFDNNCIGVVEETKQGLWRYEKVKSLRFPIIHIANSRLKDFEGIYIGESVAKIIFGDIKTLNIRPSTCRVGLLGFGSIGSSVARSLAKQGFRILFYDANPIKQIEGAVLGYTCANRKDVLQNSQLIIGTTGKGSISYRELESLESGAILASASSRTVEFPITQINKAGRMTKINEFIDDYLMPWGKSLRIINKGFPINFRQSSLPPPIADLMFCQIATSLIKLVSNNLPPGLHILSEEEENRIASGWVDYYKASFSASAFNNLGN